MQASSEMKWKLSFLKGMIWLVVCGMCDFLGNTYMPYQSIDYYVIK